MASKTVEMALINKAEKIRIHCELHIDKEKILERELDKLYKDLGRKVHKEAKSNMKLGGDLRKLIDEKKSELKRVDKSPNDATDIEELTKKLSEYVIDHFNGKTKGAVSKQILPLMARIMAEALTKYLGEFPAMVLLSTDQARTIILYCMVIGFMFHNLLKTHGIKIITSENPVSDIEIAEMEKMAQDNAELVAKLLMGDNAPMQIQD